jgi:arylsulfatase A-like enzyme
MKTLLLTVDALRASHLGQYGYHRETMPALDRLAEGGTRFTDAFTNAPYTRMSIPAFHTSRYRGHELIGDSPTIAEVLSAEGAHTACLGTLTGFRDSEGALVFDEYQEFGRDDFYERANSQPVLDAVKRVAKPVLSLSRPLYETAESVHNRLFSTHEFKSYTAADELTDAVIAWLEDAPEEFFLWVHYMEGHRPYGVHDPDPAYAADPPSEDEIMHLMEVAGTRPGSVTMAENDTIVDLYDSDLRFCSRHLDRLFDHMTASGLWEETDIYLTSDHGEEFYDHGMYFHRNVPYDELLHVPLLTNLADGAETPATVTEDRQLLDLAPTICARHGVDVEGLPFEGTDLFAGGDRQVIASGSAAIDDSAVVAGRWDGWKYIHAEGETSLYDLDADPGEQVSVVADNPEVVAEFESTIPDALFETESAGTRTPDDEVDREQLEALGYIEV